METARNVIEINAEILGGKPVFKGTRVAIQTLFDYLETTSLNDFLEGYPSVKREQAEAVIKFAEKLLTSTSLVYESAT